MLLSEIFSCSSQIDSMSNGDKESFQYLYASLNLGYCRNSSVPNVN